MKATRIFEENFFSNKAINLNRGGTRSSKTYSLCQLAVQFLFTGMISHNLTLDSGKWSIVRKTLPSLRATALLDFREIIDNEKLWAYVQVRNNRMTYICGRRMVEFYSIDDEQKIRSRKRDILHICEANELDFFAFTQLDIRTKHKIYLDFNPDDINSWINQEVEIKRKNLNNDVKVIVSTYRDNPFLSPQEVNKIEYLKIADKALWAIFGEGNYGRITGMIYHTWEFAEYPSQPKNEFIGIDFGYNPDPVAVVKVCRDGNTIYIKELAYENRWTNQDLISWMKREGLEHKSCIADSVEPKSIEELRRGGINVHPCTKGPDSVRQGIGMMKSFTIRITDDSPNMVKEIRSYIWSDAKDHTPVDGAGDHCL